MSRHQDTERLATLRALGLLDTAPEEAFDRLTRIGARALGVSVALVSLVDEHRQFFKSQIGLPEPWASARETPLSHSFCQHVVGSRAPLVVTDARADPLLKENLAIEEIGVVAYAGVPLTTSEGVVVGSFCAIDGEPRAWSEDDVAVLHDLAAAARTEMELRVAVREARRSTREAEAARAEAEHVADTLAQLQTLTDAALAHLKLDALLDEVLARVLSVFAADGACVVLAEHDPELAGLRLSAGAGILDPAVMTGEPAAFERGLAGRTVRERRPIRVDALGAGDVVSPELHGTGARCVLGIPLIVERRVIGVLLVASTQPGAWMEVDEEVLQLAADRAALAIDHARLYERERAVAETLQRAMLPRRVGPVAGMEVGAYYAAAQGQVGGDWYDVFPVGGGRVGLVVGDVVGRGLEAAVTMSNVRNALRGFALDGRAPEEVLAGLDGFIAHEDSGRMTTAVYGILDPAAQTFSWASAGHPPPLLRRWGGEARLLDSLGGPPLGIGLPAVGWRAGTVAVDPETTVVLFTDGLVERREEPIDIGLERLRRIAGQAPHEPAAVCRFLAERLVPQAGADDLALLAVRPV